MAIYSILNICSIYGIVSFELVLMHSCTTEKGANPLVATRNERRKEETRAKLLDGARRVMAEKGVEATTIRDITDAADVAAGNFYNYFDSKEELVTVAVDEIVNKMADMIDMMNETIDDPVETLASAVSAFLRMVQVDPVVTQFLMRAEIFNESFGSESRTRMVRDLNAGIASGKLDVPDANTVSHMFSGALMGYLRGRLLGQIDATEDGHAIYQVLRMIGVSAEEARKWAEHFAPTLPEGA